MAAAIRMHSFKSNTAGKRDKGLKTYDQHDVHAFGVEDMGETTEDTSWEAEEYDDETLEAMAVDDDDASMVLSFENAVMGSIQEDKELATFCVNYEEARKRLLEKTRTRGFWPLRAFKGGKKGKGKGYEGKSKGFSSRICGRTGQLNAQAASHRPPKTMAVRSLPLPRSRSTLRHASKRFPKQIRSSENVFGTMFCCLRYTNDEVHRNPEKETRPSPRAQEEVDHVKSWDAMPSHARRARSSHHVVSS